MFATISTYTPAELDEAARFVIRQMVGDMATAMEVNGWDWATNERAWFAADGETVVLVKTAMDKTGVTVEISSPDMHVRPLKFGYVSRAVSALAMLLA